MRGAGGDLQSKRDILGEARIVERAFGIGLCAHEDQFAAEWIHLYRALYKYGNTIDIYLSPTRHAKAGERFLCKALNGPHNWEQTEVINTNKVPTIELRDRRMSAKLRFGTIQHHRLDVDQNRFRFIHP